MDSRLAPDERRPGDGGREAAPQAPSAEVSPAPTGPSLTSPAAVLRLQRTAGNQAVARLVGDKQDAAAGGAPAGGGGGGGGAPPGGGGAAPPPAAPPPAAPAGAAAPAATGSPAPAVDAISGAGGTPAPAAEGPAPAGGVAAAPDLSALPASLAALASTSVGNAPGLLQVAGIGVSQLGNQANVRAYEKNRLKGPAPTGLPIGPEPPEPQEPTIPDPGNVTPAGDGDSPADIAAATQGGKAQVDAGRAGSERAASADTGVGQLAPTEEPEPIPELGLDFVWPGGGPAPIPTPVNDPEVVEALEGGFGNEGRELASRELAGGAELLSGHDQAVDQQHADAAAQLDAEQQKAKLEQIAAREEARMGVETDKAQLRRENAEAIAEYQRKAAAEQATAQAEVQRAREEARKAEEAARNQPEEDEDDEPWYSRAWGAVKSGASWAAGKVKDAVVSAYRFVKDRVTAFFSKVAELVSDGISKLREIGGRIYRGIRDKIKAGLRKLNEIVHRIGRWVVDLVERIGRFISNLVKDLVNGFMNLLGKIADFFRHAWELAIKIKDFVVALAKGVVQLFIELVRDPGAVLERFKDTVAEYIANTPAKIQEVYDTYLAPTIDGPAASKPAAQAAGTGDATAGATVVARQPAADTETEAAETHSEGVWRHLKVRGGYFVDNWWDVVKDALLEILLPPLAMYRHLPKAWDDIMNFWHEWKAGHRSRAIDSILDAAREIMAVVTTFIAFIAIAAFIIGSILGTPIVGVAALEAIGIGVIIADISLQAATIAKAIYNLQAGDDEGDDAQLEKDFGRIADSSIAIAVMLVLIILGAVASKAASALVRRFPALARAAEALKKKLRFKPKGPKEIESKLKPYEEFAPEAIGADVADVRSKLSPDYQKALDKFVAERPAAQVKAALDAKKTASGYDIAKVEGMLKNQLEWVQKQQGIHAENARWQGDMLDPKMKNGPIQQGSKDVWSRWNDNEAKAEIPQAETLNANTGERVEVFGDDYPGIDGTIGTPPRPLQLKSIPATNAIEDITRSAETAVTKARTHGFTRVEVSIEAPGRTVAQVKAAFESSKVRYADLKSVSRVRVWCDDGIYEPTLGAWPVLAPHPGPDVKDPDKQKDKVPAGVGG
jgi:hypothetical protein